MTSVETLTPRTFRCGDGPALRAAKVPAAIRLWHHVSAILTCAALVRAGYEESHSGLLWLVAVRKRRSNASAAVVSQSCRTVGHFSNMSSSAIEGPAAVVRCVWIVSIDSACADGFVADAARYTDLCINFLSIYMGPID